MFESKYIIIYSFFNSLRHEGCININLEKLGCLKREIFLLQWVKWNLDISIWSKTALTGGENILLLWQSILFYMAIKYGKPIQDRSIFVKAFYNTFPKNSGLILMTILFLLVTKYTIVSRRKVVKSKLSMHRTEVFLLSLPTTRFPSLITFFCYLFRKAT